MHKFRAISLIYKTLISPVVTYGSECWVLTAKGELQLAVFGRQLVPSETNQLGRRYNEELYQQYGEPEIVKQIRSARYRWAGHVVLSVANC
jgi:hypothetical protein